MTKPFRLACVQNCARFDVASNIAQCRGLTAAAAAKGAQLVCLPEYFSGVRLKDGLFHPEAFPEEGHPALQAFSELARELGIWLLLGSLGVKVGPAIRNRAYVLSPGGAVIARYDKIHLFDVDLDPERPLRESKTIEAGETAIVVGTPLVGIGLSICYDLRFAALYRALAKAGAGLLAVPAAFTRRTGTAHWHALNRARAIETGCYVAAPCQYGTLPGGGECFGHSLIVDPWGEILADGGESEGIIMAEIDPAKIDEARSRIPALGHDREVALTDLTISAAD